METDKIYFTPGDKVRCKHLLNAPEMYVLRKKELTFKDHENNNKILQGIICRWFTADGYLLEGVFNTKDIYKI